MASAGYWRGYVSNCVSSCSWWEFFLGNGPGRDKQFQNVDIAQEFVLPS